MRHYEEKSIDNNTWTVQQWPASVGLKILARVGKMIGGPIGKAIMSLEGESILNAKMDMKIIGDAIGDLASRIDEDKILVLFKDILSETRCDGKEVLPTFDQLFMGRYSTMIKVIVFALGVNLSIPLLDSLASLKRPEQAEAQKESIRA